MLDPELLKNTTLHSAPFLIDALSDALEPEDGARKRTTLTQKNLHLNLCCINSFWKPEDEKSADQNTLAQTNRSYLAQKKLALET